MTLTEYFTALCRAMGWEPTPWRLDVFGYWAQQEGMPFERSWNPLATTRQAPELRYSNEDIGYGPGNWNGVPVKLYATPEDGIEATRQTLMLDYYANIRRAFTDQVGYSEVVGPRDFTSWVGSDAYGTRVLTFMRNTPASREVTPAAASTSPTDDILLALFAGKEQLGTRPTMAERLAYAKWRVAEIVAGRAPSLGELAAMSNTDLPEHWHEPGGVQR